MLALKPVGWGGTPPISLPREWWGCTPPYPTACHQGGQGCQGCQGGQQMVKAAKAAKVAITAMTVKKGGGVTRLARGRVSRGVVRCALPPPSFVGLEGLESLGSFGPPEGSLTDLELLGAFEDVDGPDRALANERAEELAGAFELDLIPAGEGASIPAQKTARLHAITHLKERVASDGIGTATSNEEPCNSQPVRVRGHLVCIAGFPPAPPEPQVGDPKENKAEEGVNGQKDGPDRQAEARGQGNQNGSGDVQVQPGPVFNPDRVHGDAEGRGERTGDRERGQPLRGKQPVRGDPLEIPAQTHRQHKQDQ
jgi:hypothetical protein